MRAFITAFAVLVLTFGHVPAHAQDLAAADVFISAESAIDLVGARGVTFLHVGTDEAAFREGHLEDARFLPLSALLETREGIPAELPDLDELTELFESHGVLGHGRIVIYSDGSRGDMESLAAARAFITLEALGHPYVNIVDGGLGALTDAGAVLTTDTSAADRSELTLRPRADEVIVDADFVHEHGAHVVLADSRPAAQFLGDDPGEGVERPGHIPGAAHLYWKDFLDESGRLKPVQDLAQMWEDAGQEPGTEVITYCRTGMQASYAYAVARHLGLDVRLYDGSFIEWSNHTDYPVEVGQP